MHHMSGRIAFLLPLLLATTLSAKIGIGVHWGIDASIDMDDVRNELAAFDDLELTITPAMTTSNNPFPPSQTTIPGDLIPVYIHRTGFERKVFNFGGKLYIDIFPVIDAIELSTNFGVWEYEGVVKYPTSLTFTADDPRDFEDPADAYQVNYDSTMITLENFGINYLGLNQTPYAKLHFDLTVRKYIIRLPKSLKVINLYAGGGASMHFATPVLSAGLMEKAVGDEIANTFSDIGNMNTQLFDNTDVMKAVVEEIISGLAVPKFGLHIDAGAMVKIPVIPIGVYVDGKFMIPFGNMDEFVDLNGVGLLLNMGVALSF